MVVFRDVYDNVGMIVSVGDKLNVIGIYNRAEGPDMIENACVAFSKPLAVKVRV